jgi:hypothetical protein
LAAAPEGDSVEAMRPGRGIAIVLALFAAGCGAPYGSRGGGGDGPYDDPYYREGLSRREARILTEEQALEEHRLERLQRERRENLLERQERRRDALESTGDWDTRDERRQRRARRAQKERFDEQRKELRDDHDREWQRSGY